MRAKVVSAVFLVGAACVLYGTLADWLQGPYFDEGLVQSMSLDATRWLGGAVACAATLAALAVVFARSDYQPGVLFKITIAAAMLGMVLAIVAMVYAVRSVDMHFYELRLRSKHVEPAVLRTYAGFIQLFGYALIASAASLYVFGRRKLA